MSRCHHTTARLRHLDSVNIDTPCANRDKRPNSACGVGIKGGSTNAPNTLDPKKDTTNRKYKCLLGFFF